MPSAWQVFVQQFNHLHITGHNTEIYTISIYNIHCIMQFVLTVEAN